MIVSVSWPRTPNFINSAAQGLAGNMVKCAPRVLFIFFIRDLFSGGSTGGARGAIASPLDWGQKNFIARHTHLQTPFCMAECAKTHLHSYSNLEFQNFPGEDPRTPFFKGREGIEGKGKDREGRGGTGRDRPKEGGREGRNRGWWEGEGARHGLPPP